MNKADAIMLILAGLGWMVVGVLAFRHRDPYAAEERDRQQAWREERNT